MRKALLIAIPVLLGAQAATAETFDPEKFIADTAVNLFDAGCLQYYPDQQKFDAWVERNQFELIPPEQAARFVREPGGKAYSVNNNGIRYTLVAEPGNLCTVFVKKVDLDKAGQALTELRKRLVATELSESVSTNEKRFPQATVTITEYKYEVKGKWIMTLVVSGSDSSAGFFQLAMSASSQLRASRTPVPKTQ